MRCWGARSPMVAVTGLVVVGSLLGGCSGDGRASDAAPTFSVTDPDVVQHARAKCVSADPEGELLLYPGSLTVDFPTTLGRPSLLDAKNLSVIEVSVLAFDGSAQVTGVILDYPPLANAGIADTLADWDSRRPLDGRRLTADDGRQGVLVAVRLTDPTEDGHLTGVEIPTTNPGGDDTVRLVQQVLIEPHGVICSVAAIAATTEWTR